MKNKLILILCVAGLSLAQTSHATDQIGKIYETASYPGAIGLVIVGEAAKMIYEKIEVETFPDPYYGKSVLLKKGQGVRCNLNTKTNEYSCEFSVIKTGIDPY